MDISEKSVVNAFARNLSPEAKDNVSNFWRTIAEEKIKKLNQQLCENSSKQGNK